MKEEKKALMMNKIKSMIYELGSAHWAISQKAFDAISAVIADEKISNTNVYEKILIEGKQNGFLVLSDPLSIDGTWYAKKKGSVGILEIHGPIIPYRTWYEGWLGFVSIESLKADLEVLQSDRDIKNIIVSYDTPGGMVDGVSEFAEILSSSEKPINSHVVGDAASAGYWLASQGKTISSVNTGRVGSIGVVTTIVDFKKAYEKHGIKIFDVVSTQSPRKRTDLTTEEGRTELQQILNSIADVFIDAVKDGRKTDRDNVLENYGKGGMFAANDAINKGMIDSIVSTRNLLNSFKSNESSFYINDKNNGDSISSETVTREENMSDNNTQVEPNSIDINAIQKKERDRIRSIEGVKSLYGDKHPEVVKAVNETIDSIKYDENVSLEDAKAKASDAAFAAMESVFSKTQNAGKELANDIKNIPDSSDKEASNNDEEKKDPKRIERMVKGIESVKVGV